MTERQKNIVLTGASRGIGHATAVPCREHMPWMMEYRNVGILDIAECDLFPYGPNLRTQRLAQIIILQTFIMNRLVVLGFQAPHNGFGGRQGGNERHLVDNRGPADCIFVHA